MKYLFLFLIIIFSLQSFAQRPFAQKNPANPKSTPWYLSTEPKAELRMIYYNDSFFHVRNPYDIQEIQIVYVYFDKDGVAQSKSMSIPKLTTWTIKIDPKMSKMRVHIRTDGKETFKFSPKSGLLYDINYSLLFNRWELEEASF